MNISATSTYDLITLFLDYWKISGQYSSEYQLKPGTVAQKHFIGDLITFNRKGVSPIIKISADPNLKIISSKIEAAEPEPEEDNERAKALKIISSISAATAKPEKERGHIEITSKEIKRLPLPQDDTAYKYNYMLNEKIALVCNLWTSEDMNVAISLMTVDQTRKIILTKLGSTFSKVTVEGVEGFIENKFLMISDKKE